MGTLENYGSFKAQAVLHLMERYSHYGFDIHTATEFVSRSSEYKFACYDKIVREGELHGSGLIYFIVQGEVAVESRLHRQSGRAAVCILQPGELCGESNFFDVMPATATCTALSDVVCLAFAKSALYSARGVDTALMHPVMHLIGAHLTKRIRSANNKILIYEKILDVALSGERMYSKAHYELELQASQM
ncbi:cyclic nucleotide-binding domain-containing protein [Rhodoferax aquaticus]|uniref:Cyclic nucleotide-binding domain-containing protein n=1 Tax=Rhodoferax aquaticus TaxID=2527691 RepID=A0A515ES86_9BURK|nr:cyclic nucleotide-binding domain-containing protein [Rhodoferax aquaticus]QDL55532.1 cyclic nucleotide-binding domain-containing protein [Rhodoferax aquaticus]